MPSNEPLVGERHAFTTSDGIAWTVGEYVDAYAASNGGSSEDHCLIFESDTAMRRVRAFPSDWRKMDSDALLDLSWAR